MKKLLLLSLLLIASANLAHSEQPADNQPVQSEWTGKRVAFLGDSMTDPKNSAAKTKYWEYLRQMVGIEPHVFARSGYQWDRLYDKAVEMNDSLGTNVDAIFIFCGTNDFNHSRPMGEFFAVETDSVNHNGKIVERQHRIPILDEPTYSSNINRVFNFLKTNYPYAQIIVLTPIHRGFAQFRDTNVQPNELYSNKLGLFLDDYVETLKRGASLWSIPVIDLYSDSGIYPVLDSNNPFIANPETDRLHPSDLGHYRIARIIAARLPLFPLFPQE